MKRTNKKNLKVGDRVIVLRDIYRISETDLQRILYVSEKETGEIIEIFRPCPTGLGEKKPPYAKILMDNTKIIATLRLTSIEKLD